MTRNELQYFRLTNTAWMIASVVLMIVSWLLLKSFSLGDFESKALLNFLLLLLCGVGTILGMICAITFAVRAIYTEIGVKKRAKRARDLYVDLET